MFKTSPIKEAPSIRPKMKFYQKEGVRKSDSKLSIASRGTTSKSMAVLPILIRPEEILNDPRFGKYSDLDIAKLRLKKSEMIKKDQFGESEFIESVIQYKLSQRTSQFTQEKKDEVIDSISNIIEDYIVGKDQTKNDIHNCEIDMRKEFDNRFSKMKEFHIKAINHFLIEREIQFDMIDKKKSSEYHSTMEYSRKLAKSNNFEKAKRTQRNAESQLENFKAEQKKSIKDQYEKKINQLMVKQMEEIAVLQEKCEKRLLENKEKSVKSQKELEKIASVKIKSLIRTLISNFSRSINSSEAKQEDTKAAISYIVDSIKNIEKERGIDLGFLIESLA